MSTQPQTLVALALSVALPACSSIPAGRSAIDAVDIESRSDLSGSDVGDKIATTPTPKFLGLFRGIAYDYEVYDETVFQRDLARVERYFRGHGYLDARARAARVIRKSENHVRVEIEVDAGPPTFNGGVEVAGLESVPAPVVEAVRVAANRSLPAKDRFDEDAYKAAGIAVGRALSDRGYAYVTVEPRVQIDVGAHVADYLFTVSPGPRCTFGDITIVGLDPDGAGPRPQEIEEPPLRRTLNIDPGSVYSTAEVDSATQALLDLGVFSAVHIVPQMPDPPPESHVIPLRVEVEPARLRVLRFGGGIEFDEIKTDLHLLTGWEHHNFLGGLRTFSVEAKPGVVLFPIRINNFNGPIVLLPEERFRLQLRQPGFLEARTTGFIRPEFNVFPLLVTPNPIPQAPVVGYVEPKASVGLDRNISKLFTSLSYNFQVEDPFAYPGTAALDPALRPIILSYPQLITNLDFRDDAIHPHAGIFLGNNLQVAGGGSADDVRVQPEVRGYIPLGRHVTFASRASVGFLFPFGGYTEPQLTSPHDSRVTYVPCAPGKTDPNCYSDPETKQVQESDIETVYFRGLYSGGPNTNRGFPLRGIAPFGFVPFLSPGTASALTAAGCNPYMMPVPGVVTSSTPCTIPIAGLSLWEFSNELRIQVAGPFATKVFCDMGDVSPKEVDIRLGRPHLSCGSGASYDTPIGPIRLDIGYRIEGAQVIGFADDYAANRKDPTEGIQPRIGSGKYALPLAIAIGIGEAF
jgi:outer membrane protein insertion porin family/translocation and assembly module TamA